MKKILLSSLFVLVLLVEFVAQISLFSPKKDFFEIKNEKGNVFHLGMCFDDVKAILGEPVYLTNLWKNYADASCAYYEADYDGISFTFKDSNYKVDRIMIISKDYYLSNKRFTVDSSFDEITDYYSRSPTEIKVENDKNGNKELNLFYSTENRKIIKKIDKKIDTCSVGFNFDYGSNKCKLLYVVCSY